MKILQQRGEDVANRTLWYFEDTDTPHIDYALTVSGDGRVLHLSDAALKNESVHAQWPLYQRRSRLRFACMEPRPGSILDVQTAIKRKLSAPVESFYADEIFQGEGPVLRKEVFILLPESEQDRVVAQCKNDNVKEAGMEDANKFYLQHSVSSDSLSRGKNTLRLWTLTEPQPGIMP